MTKEQEKELAELKKRLRARIGRCTQPDYSVCPLNTISCDLCEGDLNMIMNIFAESHIKSEPLVLKEISDEEILKFMPIGEIYIDQKLGVIKWFVNRAVASCQKQVDEEGAKKDENTSSN